MRRSIVTLAALTVLTVCGDQSSGQEKVVRRHFQPEIGEVTVVQLENGDTMVKINDEDTKPGKDFNEKTQELETWKQLKRDLPYRGNPDIRMGTFGQQVKFCDWVIVGKVSRIERGGAEDKDYPVSLTLNVETNLFGKLPQDSVTLSLMKWHFDAKDEDLAAKLRQEYNIGDRFLVFIVRGRAPVLLDIMKFTFEKPAHKMEQGDQPTLLRDSLGVIELKGGAAEREILEAVDGYLACLRMGNRDAEKYYQLLRWLEHSNVERIRDNAKSDLVNLLSSPLIAEKVLTDETVDVGIRKYARFALESQKKRDAKAH